MEADCSVGWRERGRLIAGDGAFERIGVTVGAKLWRRLQIDGYHYMDVVDGQFFESERDSMSNGELSRQL